MAGKTLYDKLWESHVVREESDGTCLLYIDRHLMHEVTSPQAFEGLRVAGRKVRHPENTLAVADHNVPTTKDRLQGIKDREAQRMQDILKGTTSIEYLVTNVRRTSSTRLDFDGFFYNGTGQPLQKVDSMVLSVTLYNHGEQVYQNSYDFYNTIYLGRVMPHQRQSRSLWVTDNSSIPVFDEYEVSAGSVHWTYWGS